MSDWIENEVEGAKQFMQHLIQANTALRAENERLRAILGNVSRGVQTCRTDINMAVVWLPAIQAVNQYFRDLDEAAALKETDNG